MKKTIALLLVLTLGLSMLLLTGCGGSGSGGDALKGTWTGKDSNDFDNTFVFDGKGGLKFTGGFENKTPGTYTISGDQVDITIPGWGFGDSDVRQYTFVIEGSNLTLTAPADQYYVSFDLTKK